jgi:YggT family protein
VFGPGCTGETTISQVVCLFVYFLTLSIIARAILSWFQLDPRSPLIQALDSITAPILDPIRRIMPRIAMIDLSPIVAILLLNFISNVIQQQLG